METVVDVAGQLVADLRVGAAKLAGGSFFGCGNGDVEALLAGVYEVEAVLAAAKVNNIADPERGKTAAEKAVRDRRAYCARVGDRVHLDAVGDVLSGTILKEALEAIEQELFEQDWAEAKTRLDDPTSADLARSSVQRTQTPNSPNRSSTSSATTTHSPKPPSNSQASNPNTTCQVSAKCSTAPRSHRNKP
jgi:hypothetical protein